MKYKELLSERIMAKLLNTSFRNPSVNIRIWNFYAAIKDSYEFMRNEVAKNPKDEQYFNQMLEQEINCKLPKFELSIEDFKQENCSFSEDKHFWFTANEINAICSWINKYEKSG